jgi:hypothetical protein
MPSMDMPGETRPRWWAWNPYRSTTSNRTPTPAPSASRAAWWSWNPYRRDVAASEADIRRDAYAAGLRDGRLAARSRRRGHPLLTLVLLVLSAGSLGYGYLTIEHGSFAAGGAVIDQTLAGMAGAPHAPTGGG